MNDLCPEINRKIPTRKDDAFHFIFSMAYGWIYIVFPIQNAISHLNDNLRDALYLRDEQCNSIFQNGYGPSIPRGKPLCILRITPPLVKK